MGVIDAWLREFGADALAFGVSAILVAIYYAFLLRRTRRDPTSSIHGVNELARSLWVKNVMANPGKDVMAVQTLRNFIMNGILMVSTSTLLLNDTLDRILAGCPGARWFAMIGPSAGCLPDGLFARGVTLVGGTWVRDREAFTAALVAGEPLGAHASKFALTARGYPGWRDLVERSRA